MGGEHWELPGKSVSPALGGDPSLPTSLPPNCFWRSLCVDINTKRRQRLAYTLGEEERWPNFVLVQRYLLNTGILFLLCPHRKKSSSLPSPSDSQNSTCFSVSGMRVLRARKVCSGHGNPLQYYSCWRIPWTEEPGGLQSLGWQRVGHDWSDLACTGMRVLRARKEREGNIKKEKKERKKKKNSLQMNEE